MSEIPKKIQQSEKYPDEDCSVILGNCYDKKVTAEIVRQYNSHDALLEACEKIKKIEDGCFKRGVGYDQQIDDIAEAAITQAEKDK